jgi:hypothetical protein
VKTVIERSSSVIGRLETLRKREQALREAIAAEKVRQQKQQAKADARLYSVMGEALALHAARSHDFKLMLQQVLQSAALTDADRNFLKTKGWL